MEYFNRIKKSAFLKNASILTGGFFLGQLVSILISPILTRIYSPSDFGVLSVFSAILAILIIISAFQLHYAIPLPSSNQKAFNLLVLGTLSIILISMIISFLLYFSPKVLFVNEEIRDYAYLIPIGTLFAGLYQIFNYWAIRKEKYNTIAKTKLYQALLGSGTQIVLGLLNLKPIGLLIGNVLKQATGFSSLAKILLSDRKTFTRPSLSSLYDTLREFKKFPLISTWSSLINVLGLQAPVLLIAHYYNTKIAGFFSLSMIVISIPLTTLGKAISQVFYKEAAVLRKTDKLKLKSRYLRIARNLFLFALIPCSILVFFGPSIFTFIFGKSWNETGLIVQVLSLMYIAQFTVVPLSSLLLIIEKQELQFYWDLFRLILIVTSILIPAYLGFTYLTTITFYSSSMFIAYVTLLFLHLKELNK